MLTDVAPLLRKISYGETLTVDEAKRAFGVIGDEDAESYYYLALTFGLMARGPTLDELYGFCLDRASRVVTIASDIQPDQIIDMSGGGGGRISTMNVSTAASLILASAGIYVAKQAAPAVTGYTGSLDLLSELGVDIPISNGDPHQVAECLRALCFAAYYYSAFSTPRFENFLRWRATIKRIGLGYLTPLHLVSFVYSLFRVTNRVYGVFSSAYLRTLVDLFKKFEYRRVLVFQGLDGTDEVSNVGPTQICELHGDSVREYTITPDDLGIRTVQPAAIEARGREENIIDFLRVIYGTERGAKRDLVAINAAAGLYVMGRTKTLREGTELALSLLESGGPAKKLEAVVGFFGNEGKLESWRQRAL